MEIFLFYHKNVCCVYSLESHHRGDLMSTCVYSLESPHRGDSNEYTQRTIIL